MSIVSKLKEAMVGLKAGRVTLDYPAQPRPVAENFRGRPIFDAQKCIGCAGCANNCPARESSSSMSARKFASSISGPALHLLRTLRGCLPGESHHHEP